MVSDVNHASDLIKKKRTATPLKNAIRTKLSADLAEVLRENKSPDKAVQFSNLYARLLTQPVLSQKWAILYLLHQLADSDDSDDDSSRSENSRLNQGLPAQNNGKSVATYQDVSDHGDLNEAFSIGGLPRLPARDRGSQDTLPTTTQIERPEPTGMQKAVAVEEDSVDPGKARIIKATESALLRDLPFTFQGLSSVNFTFTSPSTLTLPANLPLPLVSLLHDLAEPSLLYRNLSAFVESGDEGLIGQSLRSALGNELRSYLHLIAMIEGEIRRASSTSELNEIKSGAGKAGVTLKRCLVWMREPTTRLRLMSFMVEEAKSKILLRFLSSHG